MKIRCVITGHNWKGCLCETCGEARDEGHVWEPDVSEPCKFHCRCGVQQFRHDWANGFCRQCAIPAPPPDPTSIYDTALTAHISLRDINSQPLESDTDIGTGMLGTHAPGGTIPAEKRKPEALPVVPRKPDGPSPQPPQQRA